MGDISSSSTSLEANIFLNSHREVKMSEKLMAWFRGAKPYLLMIALQFGSAGMYILAKDALNKGMSHYVFIVYRNACAAISLGPFALVLERSPLLNFPILQNSFLLLYILLLYINPFCSLVCRKVRPKMTFRIFFEIMALAFVE